MYNSVEPDIHPHSCRRACKVSQVCLCNVCVGGLKNADCNSVTISGSRRLENRRALKDVWSLAGEETDGRAGESGRADCV